MSGRNILCPADGGDSCHGRYCTGPYGDKGDLSGYTESSYADISNGQWYTAAALWAREIGLIGEEESFSALESMTRADLAVMLKKYLVLKGVGCAVSEKLVEFEDAALMTAEQNDAFQALYSWGIIKGVGNNNMVAQEVSTRAQLAALLSKISILVEDRQFQEFVATTSEGAERWVQLP